MQTVLKMQKSNRLKKSPCFVQSPSFPVDKYSMYLVRHKLPLHNRQIHEYFQNSARKKICSNLRRCLDKHTDTNNMIVKHKFFQPYEIANTQKPHKRLYAQMEIRILPYSGKPFGICVGGSIILTPSVPSHTRYVIGVFYLDLD